MAHLLKQKTIAEITAQLRKDGQSVVLTHGTFDLFHYGHWDFIKKSKRKGDILIVGVDSDKRVSYFKGRNRPIIPIEYRAKLLTAIKDIDFVFVLAEENNLEESYYIDLYNRIHPSVVTYGRNFDFKFQFLKKKNQIRGTSYDELITSNFKNLSTTNIIHQIAKDAKN